MSQQIQLFQQIFSLYSLINSYVKPTTPELQQALKTLKGLYNQYDCIKNVAYPLILQGLRSNWGKYSQMLELSSINIAEIFGIISDQLGDNDVALKNIAKLKPLASVELDVVFVNKVKKILRNIEKIVLSV